jgi:hypothetical protein
MALDSQGAIYLSSQFFFLRAQATETAFSEDTQTSNPVLITHGAVIEQASVTNCKIGDMGTIHLLYSPSALRFYSYCLSFLALTLVYIPRTQATSTLFSQPKVTFEHRLINAHHQH